MIEKSAAEWWALLPEGIRAQADGYVLQDASFKAVQTVYYGGRALGLGLGDAQVVVGERYRHFGDRIARTPDAPLDLESLAARAAGCKGRIVAVEAVWDGDTVHDWFVNLVAVTAEPEGQFALACIYWGAGERFLEGGAPSRLSHPSAGAADRAGRALAEHLSVPFHFGSPDTPDDDAPRWRP